MSSFIDWISKNKEWVFSGAGFVLIGWIVLLVRRFFLKPKSTQNIEANNVNQIIQMGPGSHFNEAEKKKELTRETHL